MLRSKIEEYLREIFDIHKSVKKIGIRIVVELDGKFEFNSTVREASTLGTLLATLEQKKQELLAAKVIKLSGKHKCAK